MSGSPIDKLTELAGAAANPLSAAESTLKAARGVVNQGHGLVEDVRKIAAVEQKRANQRADERAIQQSVDRRRAADRVGKREVNRAAEEYNAAVATTKAATERVLIEQKLAREEHDLIWSMSASEREAYLAEKRRQIELRRKEERRIELERIKRKELRDGIIGAVLSVIAVLFGVYWMFDWVSVKATGLTLMERIR